MGHFYRLFSLLTVDNFPVQFLLVSNELKMHKQKINFFFYLMNYAVEKPIGNSIYPKLILLYFINICWIFIQVDTNKCAHRMLPSKRNRKLFCPSPANIVNEQTIREKWNEINVNKHRMMPSNRFVSLRHLFSIKFTFFFLLHLRSMKNSFCECMHVWALLMSWSYTCIPSRSSAQNLQKPH